MKSLLTVSAERNSSVAAVNELCNSDHFAQFRVNPGITLLMEIHRRSHIIIATSSIDGLMLSLNVIQAQVS